MPIYIKNHSGTSLSELFNGIFRGIMYTLGRYTIIITFKVCKLLFNSVK